MPSQYEALVAALKLLDVPFAEYGWKTRPEGAYGVVSLDFESDSLDGCGEKIDRAWSASVDIFYQKLTERSELMEAVEEILTEICGDSWRLNSIQHESSTGLFHVEWVCEVLDEEQPEEPEPENQQNTDPTDPTEPAEGDPENTDPAEVTDPEEDDP